MGFLTWWTFGSTLWFSVLNYKENLELEEAFLRNPLLQPIFLFANELKQRTFYFLRIQWLTRRTDALNLEGTLISLLSQKLWSSQVALLCEELEWPRVFSGSLVSQTRGLSEAKCILFMWMNFFQCNG